MKLKKKSLRLKYSHPHTTLRTFINFRLIRIFAIHTDKHRIYHTYACKWNVCTYSLKPWKDSCCYTWFHTSYYQTRGQLLQLCKLVFLPQNQYTHPQLINEIGQCHCWTSNVPYFFFIKNKVNNLFTMHTDRIAERWLFWLIEKMLSS